MRRPGEESFDITKWEPRTRLGRLVQSGAVTSMSEALATRLPLREAQVVDALLPGMEDEVLDVNMVQRMTDSGRRVRFSITVTVGNKNGFVGLGQFEGKEVGPSIRKAIDVAKLHIIEVRRGCGSWECGCYTPHSLPIEILGRSGSTRVLLKPAPRGVGLATGNVAKHVLRLAGVKDVWGLTRGQSRTTVNYAKATYNALSNISKFRITDAQREKLKIRAGEVSP
ncbi:MAG TPA: 30S ribosomal protein S5 [Candidatus Thermoplasmatota archaeon]